MSMLSEENGTPVYGPDTTTTPGTLQSTGTGKLNPFHVDKCNRENRRNADQKEQDNSDPWI
jgi:hypothetical protein